MPQSVQLLFPPLVLATSGIDYDIKLWEPVSDDPCDLSDLDSIILRNETMLQESRNTITVPSSFILHVLAYLNRRRRSESTSSHACTCTCTCIIINDATLSLLLCWYI